MAFPNQEYNTYVLIVKHSINSEMYKPRHASLPHSSTCNRYLNLAV